MEIFSKEIKELRKSRKMSQTELSQALGISLRNYQRYENGERNPSSEVIIKAAEFFDVPTNFLLGLDDDYDREKNHLMTVYAQLSPEGRRMLVEMADFLVSRSGYSMTAVM